MFREGLDLSEARIEQVFRNNVNGAFSDGQEKALNHILVADAFPYRRYSATLDQRVRPEHAILETSGLNGTAIYRKDDPVWQLFRPPWEWNAVMPDTVLQGRAQYALKSFYSGKVFELLTESGRRLTVTAKHPVLTREGFVFADALTEG